MVQSGLALHNQGRLEEAEKIYRDVLRSDPGNFDALHLLGLMAYQNGRHEQAVDLISRAISVNPNVPFAYTNRGNALKVLNRAGEALANYKRATQLDPSDADAHGNLGVVLEEMGRFAEALASYDKAIAVRPDFAEVYLKRGNTLKQLGRLDEAVTSFTAAIAYQPGFGELYNNLGTALYALRRYDEAASNFDAAIRLKPAAETWYNRGLALKALTRFDEAITSFKRAVEIRPNYADAILNQCFVELLTANFPDGWKHFEWRVRRELAGNIPRLTSLQQAAGKTVLVHWEQGLGDTIQFCRYAGMLKEQGARVLFAPQPNLKMLLESFDGGIELVDDRNPPAFDLHIPLLSLPGLFGTVLETIPARRSYLSADPARVAHWKEKIGTGGFKVGICWKGSAVHVENVSRSFPAEFFQQMSGIAHVRLISLLKSEETIPSGIEALEGLDTGTDAFADTAAVMMNLDLVITADTSIAHLAGALGVPTWVALRHVPDWRWLMERADSPWYPSMRLFRQESDADWKSVIRQMETALAALAAERPD